MAWLAVSLAAFFLFAVAVVTDKFMLTKTTIVPLSYAFYICLMSAAASSAVFLVPVLLADGRLLLPSGFPLATVVVCGVAQFLGLLFMFEAVLRGEVSKASPVLVSLQPVVSLLLTLVLPPLFALAAPRIDLGLELVAARKLPGVAMIVAGSYLLSQAGGRKTAFSPATWVYVVLAGFFLALANVFASISYRELTFAKAFLWTRWMSLVGALVYVTVTGKFSALRRRSPAGANAGNPERGNPGHPRDVNPGTADPGSNPGEEPQVRGRWIPLVFLFGQGCGALAVLLQNYALKLGNVVAVTALGGVQFFFVIALTALFSRFFPRLFSEPSTRRTVLQKVLWSALLFGGVVVLAV